ncbi:MAG: DUF5979 domain-containing protein [Clostridiales bacterium]|nr:DUF5979 domain-containing protein [Clostridiales bacterium]
MQADSSNDDSFDFNLNLKDSSNNALTDTYAYNIHSEDGTLVSTGTITNNDTFSLKDGQYILVSGLPDGTQCTVSETTTGYVTSYTVDSGSKTTGTEASAIIEKDETVTVHFINSVTYELPSTGGFGTRMFGPIGLALCGSTGVLLNRCRKRYRV